MSKYDTRGGYADDRPDTPAAQDDGHITCHRQGCEETFDWWLTYERHLAEDHAPTWEGGAPTENAPGQ